LFRDVGDLQLVQRAEAHSPAQCRGQVVDDERGTLLQRRVSLLPDQIAEAGAGSIPEVRIPFQGLRSRQLADQPVDGRHRELGLMGELRKRERSPHREGAEDRNDLAGDGAARLARVAGHPVTPFDHVGLTGCRARG
jgi:hypothetical protein